MEKQQKKITDHDTHPIREGVYKVDPSLFDNPKEYIKQRPVFIYQQEGIWKIEKYNGKVTNLTVPYASTLSRIPIHEITDAVFIAHTLQKRGKFQAMLERLIKKEFEKSK